MIFKSILKRLGLIKEKGESSEFSKFFREASSREKKKIFLEVAKKASHDQKKILEMIT